MSGRVFWTEEKIIDSMINWKKKTGRWPVSRSWWYSNTGKWPSFMTVCRKGGWTQLLTLAKEREKEQRVKPTYLNTVGDLGAEAQ